MNSHPTLSQRSRLVDVANHVLPQAWKAGVLRRPEFDTDYLCEMVRRDTGLDDFGDEWFMQPLERLNHGLREEAGLNAVGRFGAFGQLEKTLRERLWTEHWFREHPEILQRRVKQPVIVVGPMRSGTTRLHRLLASDARFAHLRLFETICPTPDPEARRKRDRRRMKAAAILGLVHRLNPNTAVVHPTGPMEPEEELGLLVASIWGMKHEAQWQVPGYGRWSEGQDATPAYRHMARLLRLVGWARGDDDSRPWVLKTPQHMLDLPALLAVFPDARIVFTHRAPPSVVGSSCSLVWNQMIIHSDRVDPERVGSEWLRKTELQIERMRAARAAIPAEQRIDVRYEDMERDWLGVMGRIYDFLDMDIAPALPAMTSYIADAERQRRRHPHRYSLPAFGLGAGEVAEQFTDYIDSFDLDGSTTAGAQVHDGVAAPEPVPMPIPSAPSRAARRAALTNQAIMLAAGSSSALCGLALPGSPIG